MPAVYQKIYRTHHLKYQKATIRAMQSLTMHQNAKNCAQNKTAEAKCANVSNSLQTYLIKKKIDRNKTAK